MLSLPCSIKYNKTKTTKLNHYLSILYKDLVKSFKYIENLDINIDINNQSQYTTTSNIYFPHEIQQYIIQNIKQTIIYSAKINGINVILKISNCNNPGYSFENITISARLVFMIVYMLSLYSTKNCVKNLVITIFLTPFKKIFPLKQTDIIGPEHVNSGFSNIGCQETSNITIYREEEWIKVLIHELFHNLNLDFASKNIKKWISLLRSKFEIESEYNIYETYCETWARILNVAITSFFAAKTNNKSIFLSKFNMLIQKERLFSLKQANLILKRFKYPSEYREKSNVFCYYILTASLLNDYLEFFIWCDENNTNLLRFKSTDKSIKSFIELILIQVNSKEFNTNLKCISSYNMGNEKSLRMTIT